jgi:hypothetical protein
VYFRPLNKPSQADYGHYAYGDRLLAIRLTPP